MPKVTVLVAVYNASQFLRCCLDSLRAQTLADFQAVCVDDCSTDDSLALLRDYSQADPRIEVVHLSENRGQAHARNEGLALARGEYICMLDADDWLSADALERAVEVFEHQNDMDSVLFEVSMDGEDRSYLYPLPSFRQLSGDEAFRLSLTWQLHGLYMVRADIHRRIPYDETCRLYSDDNTTRLHYLASRRVGRCSGVYHYRQHAASATHAVSVRRFDYLRANESMCQSLLRMQAAPEVVAVYENHRWLNVVGVYLFYYLHGRELSPEERRYGLQELHRAWQSIDRSLLSPRQTRKLGYRPMSRWWLFRAEEWLYFSLRALLGRNQEQLI